MHTSDCLYADGLALCQLLRTHLANRSCTFVAVFFVQLNASLGIVAYGLRVVRVGFKLRAGSAFLTTVLF